MTLFLNETKGTQAWGAGSTIRRHPPLSPPLQSQSQSLGVGPNSASIWTAPIGEGKQGAAAAGGGGCPRNSLQQGLRGTRRQDSDREGPRSPAAGELLSQEKRSHKGHWEEPHFQSPLSLQKKRQDLQNRDDFWGNGLTGRGHEGAFWSVGNLPGL